MDALRKDIDKHGKVKAKKGQQAPPAAMVGSPNHPFLGPPAVTACCFVPFSCRGTFWSICKFDINLQLWKSTDDNTGWTQCIM